MTELLKIAVVEDEKAHADVLIHFAEAWLREKKIAFCIRTFPDGAAFLFEWEQDQAWDALFFDIQMPGLNGIELAKKIRQENNKTAIVFVTGITDYLLEGYEVAALHYLLKPIDAEKIASCMERMMDLRRGQKKQPVFLTEARELEKGEKKDRVTLRLLPEDIMYLEAFAHNTELHTKDRHYVVREGISLWKERLPTEMFCSCHRSFLVNLLYVAHLEKDALVLDDGSRIPVSRKSYRETNEAFIRFYSSAKTTEASPGEPRCEKEGY